MNIRTLLNEGLDTSKMEADAVVNTRGSLKEAFEEGQPELDLDMTAASGKGLNIQGQKDRMYAYGQSVGAKYAPIIMAEARKVINNVNKSMGVDLAANAKVYDMDEEDLLMEDDRFFDIVGELCESFLEGMETEWPLPITD